MKSKYLKLLIFIMMVFSFLTLKVSNSIVKAAENETIPEVEIRVNALRNKDYRNWKMGQCFNSKF